MAAEAVRTRFFGLAPDSSAPRSSARGAETSSSDAIQRGVSVALPTRGRCHHLRAPSTMRATPASTRPQSAIADEGLSGSSAPPNTTTTSAATIPSPAIHPAVNSRPLHRPCRPARISTIPITGKGLRATASAAGSTAPIAWISTGSLPNSTPRTLRSALSGPYRAHHLRHDQHLSPRASEHFPCRRPDVQHRSPRPPPFHHPRVERHPQMSAHRTQRPPGHGDQLGRAHGRPQQRQ